MRQSNLKSLRSSFALLCLLCVCVALGVSSTAQKQTALKDVFKDDFRIGAALNGQQIFERDARGAEIVRTHFNSITP